MKKDNAIISKQYRHLFVEKRGLSKLKTKLIGT